MASRESRPAVLVTGASRGIGFAIARTLAEHGYRVFAGARRPADMVRLARVGGHAIMPLPLDIANPDSIQAAAARLAGELGSTGLAGLVNNAGVAPMSPVEQSSLEMLEEMFRVNVFGPVLLIQALLPHLRAGRGRIINVSSVNGKVAFPFHGAYSASKFALEALSDALRIELTPWKLPVIVVQPAAFNTTIRAEGLLRWQEARERLPQDQRALYADAIAAVEDILPGVDAGTPDVQRVAEAVLESLTVPDPETRYVVGDSNRLMALVSKSDADRDQYLRGLLGLR